MNVSMGIKRLFDIMSSFLALVVLSPLLCLVGILIRLESPGKALFIQTRVGKDGKLFNLYKFRSMLPESATKGHIAKTDNRITRLGKILRVTSLDELPQLINVLKGEMSLIGPRPTLPYQVEQYDEQQKKRLNMRPGLTGYAQVNGRNNLTWPEKIAFDVYYVENWSLWLDTKIFFKTFKVLLKIDQVFAKTSFEDSYKSNKNF